MEHTSSVLDQDTWIPEPVPTLDSYDDPTEALVLRARRVERQERGRLDLASRHMRGVTSLLAVRDDLRGVYAFADVVEEAVRWSA